MSDPSADDVLYGCPSGRFLEDVGDISRRTAQGFACGVQSDIFHEVLVQVVADS